MQKLLKQRGFSLIEVAIVLAIVGLVIGGVWAAASAVSQRNKETKAATQLLQTVQNIRSLYSGQPDNTGISTSTLIIGGAFPADAVVSSSDVRNPWGGSVSAGAISTQQFNIVYYGVPSASCVNLLANNETLFRNSGLTIIFVNLANLALPASPTQAATLCASSNPAQIEWRFNLRG